jgi:hypothetical protein
MLAPANDSAIDEIRKAEEDNSQPFIQFPFRPGWLITLSWRVNKTSRADGAVNLNPTSFGRTTTVMRDRCYISD